MVVVCVLGEKEAVQLATTLVDDLVDAEGVHAKEVLAAWRAHEAKEAVPRNTLTSINILAELLHTMGNNAEAEPLCREVLNGFLRALAGVQGDAKTALLRHPQLTFAATIGHVPSAIRKLAAVATGSAAVAATHMR